MLFATIFLRLAKICSGHASLKSARYQAPSTCKAPEGYPPIPTVTSSALPQSIKMLSGDQSESKWISGGTTCCSSLRTDKISPGQARGKTDCDSFNRSSWQLSVRLSGFAFCTLATSKCCLIEFQNHSVGLRSQLQKGIRPSLLARVKTGCQRNLRLTG